MSRARDELRVIQAVMDTWTPVPVVARIAGVSDHYAAACLKRLYESGDMRFEYLSRRLDEHNPTALYRRRQKSVRILGVWMPIGDMKDIV
mgnify:FL=1